MNRQFTPDELRRMAENPERYTRNIGTILRYLADMLEDVLVHQSICEEALLDASK